jgi:hypothetical protein
MCPADFRISSQFPDALSDPHIHFMDPQTPQKKAAVFISGS